MQLMNEERLKDIASNLDCCDVEDLAELLHFIGDFAQPLRAAQALFDGDLKRTILTRQYAQNKHQAVQARLDGRIPAALYYEQICDKIYTSMPENMKW